MPLVYIDMIKHAVPVSVRGMAGMHSAQYLVFGSYDLLHYTIPEGNSPSGVETGGLRWLEQQHEDRHALDWNYERHPLCLYCSDASSERLTRIMDPQGHPSRPMVLTMAWMEKRPLLSSEPGLDSVLKSLEDHIGSLLGGRTSLDYAVCWNMGNADFVIVSRPERLGELKDLYLALEAKAFAVRADTGEACATTKLRSLSSYCAFPMELETDDGARRVVSQRIDEARLTEWLDKDRGLEFIDLVDWLPGPGSEGGGFDASHFLFGDRDFQYVKRVGNEDASPKESVMHIMSEMLDPACDSRIRSSSLIPSLPMGADARVEDAEDVESRDAPWDDVEMQMDLVAAALDVACETADAELARRGASDRARDRCLRQIAHCKNTLYALYCHAIRLHAAAYQDDVLCVVRRLYDALAETLFSYRAFVEEQSPQGGVGFAHAVSVMYPKIMHFVSELQHVYTVLAVSPHSYMETYYGSMRSLNAASKLWISYNGVIQALCELFPVYDRPLRENEDPRRCAVLLSPYREKSSKSMQMLPELSSGSILVLLQLNYPMMFDVRQALFVIAHELGHYVFNTTRSKRAECMVKTIVSQMLIDNRMGDALRLPLFYLSKAPVLDSRAGKVGAEQYAALLSDEARAKEWLCLSLCGDLDGARCKAMYKEMADELGTLHRAVAEEEVERFANGRADWASNEGEAGDGFVDNYGRDVVAPVARVAREQYRRVIAAVEKRVIENNVSFLRGIGKYEAEYSVPFERYGLARLGAYWETRLEIGLGEIEPEIYPIGEFEGRCKRTLDIFRETHADIFACKAIGYSLEDYLEHVSRCSDENPRLICSERDLVRIMAVCEAVFQDDGNRGLAEWFGDGERCLFDRDVRRDAAGIAVAIRASLYYRYLREYGRCVAESVDRRATELDGDERQASLLQDIQQFARCGDETPRYTWRFWLHAMHGG